MCRFIIAELTPVGTYRIDHDFDGDDWAAENAFRLLYKDCNGYVLFKQQAVIDCELAGSRDEADNAVGKDSLQPRGEPLDDLLGDKF